MCLLLSPSSGLCHVPGVVVYAQACADGDAVTNTEHPRGCEAHEAKNYRRVLPAVNVVGEEPRRN